MESEEIQLPRYKGQSKMIWKTFQGTWLISVIDTEPKPQRI